MSRERTGKAGDDASSGRRLAIAVALAVLLHVAILAPAGYLMPAADGSQVPRRALSVALYEASRQTLAPLLYEPAVPIPHGQVVDAPDAAGAESESPPDARFLSETGRRVEREMQAQIRIAGPHRVGSTVAGPGERAQGRPVPGIFGPRSSGEGAGERPAPHGPQVVVAPPGTPATTPGMPTAGTQDQAGTAAAPRIAATRPSSPATNGDDGDWPLPPGDALAPGVEVLAEAVAGSGLDHLDGVEQGDVTALSTGAFAHSGFYRRVRDRVAQYWDVPGAFDHNDPHGTIYGYRDRETLVLVTLDCAGSLVSTILLEDSGARFLDELAVDSIGQAAPFHNPPRELCDARRDIITFTFGFYVETDQGPSLRVHMGR